jgi:hypothetical protein
MDMEAMDMADMDMEVMLGMVAAVIGTAVMLGMVTAVVGTAVMVGMVMGGGTAAVGGAAYIMLQAVGFYLLMAYSFLVHILEHTILGHTTIIKSK